MSPAALCTGKPPSDRRVSTAVGIFYHNLQMSLKQPDICRPIRGSTLAMRITVIIEVAISKTVQGRPARLNVISDRTRRFGAIEREISRAVSMSVCRSDFRW